MLGDGSLSLSRTSVTPYFIFTQTVKRFDYAWFVFQNLIHYCVRYPILNVSTRYGVKHPFMQVSTRSYPIMLTLYDLFYPLVEGVRVKAITINLLTYLDEIALAYWAMDDGAWTRSGFYFHTKGFTFSDVYLLAGMLHYNFGLHCTVQNHSEMPVLYIRVNSMTQFKRLVSPHIHNSMMYKFK